MSTYRWKNRPTRIRGRSYRCLTAEAKIKDNYSTFLHRRAPMQMNQVLESEAGCSETIRKCPIIEVFLVKVLLAGLPGGLARRPRRQTPKRRTRNSENGGSERTVERISYQMSAHSNTEKGYSPQFQSLWPGTPIAIAGMGRLQPSQAQEP